MGVRSQRHSPAALYPRESPGTLCIEVWVGPRAGLDRWGKSTIQQQIYYTSLFENIYQNYMMYNVRLI